MLGFVVVCLLGYLIYVTLIKPLSYWKERGIPYARPWPIVGNTWKALFRINPLTEVVKDSYNYFPDKRYHGIHQFNKPVLVVRDVDLVKQITVKDFDHFIDHNPIVSAEVDPLMGGNLFQLRGQRWRDMRATLSPSFTGSKMRMMFTLLTECADEFTEHFSKKSGKEVDMKDAFTRFTNDAIASIAFGLKVNSLKEPENEFYLMGKRATNFTGLMTLKFILFNTFPSVSKTFKIKLFAQAVDDFFRHIVKETIKQREETGLVRPDMIHLLMEARKGNLKDDPVKDNKDQHEGFATVEESPVGRARKHHMELSDDDITAQAFIFFFGGFESASTLMSFLAYELAINPEVQEKLQKEIDETFEACKGKLTYEAVMGMKYLDAVVSETLRMWPPVFQLDRICAKDYTIAPTRDDEIPLTVEKGQLVVIPVIGFHHDPKFFPNPEKFNPDRFSEENKHKIDPGAYMPFGVGPRNCIASRLALLENKTLFFYFLSKYEVYPVEKTPIPLRLSCKTFNMVPDKGFWLGVRQRQKSKTSHC